MATVAEPLIAPVSAFAKAGLRAKSRLIVAVGQPFAGDGGADVGVLEAGMKVPDLAAAEATVEVGCGVQRVDDFHMGVAFSIPGSEV